MIRNDHASRDTGLGLRLQDLRHEQRLSISELGRRARISKAYLSQLEAGQRARPSVEKLVAIASVLQVPVSELLPRAEELPGRAGVAPALNELIDERALDSSTVDMLASIRFAGPVPRTRTRWEYIWNAIRTSELLDKDHAIPVPVQATCLRKSSRFIFELLYFAGAAGRTTIVAFMYGCSSQK